MCRRMEGCSASYGRRLRSVGARLPGSYLSCLLLLSSRDAWELECWCARYEKACVLAPSMRQPAHARWRNAAPPHLRHADAPRGCSIDDMRMLPLVGLVVVRTLT